VTAAQLFSALGGTPQPGGTWTPVPGGAGTYTYTVNAVAPCTGTASAQVVVTEQAQPNAGTNGTLTICQGQTVTAAQLFAALGGTPDAGGTWTPAPGGAGTYTYTVNAVAPCTGTASAQVVVTEQAQPNAGTNGSLTICQGQTVTAADLFNALGGTPDAGGTWTPAPGGAGTYTYTVNAVAPCTGTATAQVVVTETIVDAPIVSEPTICGGQSATLTVNNPTASYLWYDVSSGGTPIYNGVAFNTPNLTSNATYYVEAVANGCTSSRIPVNVFVQTVSSMNDTTVCIYDQLTLNGLPTGGIWLGVGITNNVFNASIAGVGSHLITYEFNGCTASFIITVEDTLIPNVVVKPSLPATVTLPQTEFNFTDQTLGAVQWHWNFGNGDTSNLSSVSIKYLQPGTYTVTLTIQNATGCVSTVVLGPIIVEEGIFEVPNVFTPNGDGVNDVFLPKVQGYELKSLLVYDRWGIELYSSEGSVIGWNGKLKNGADAVDGVYNYVIELQKSDGTKFKRVGVITLTR
jgi:gliding motility-associated-like protein